MRSARSAKASVPWTEYIASYEYIASTTPHNSMPREGERVCGTGVISSPRYLFTGGAAAHIPEGWV